MSLSGRFLSRASILRTAARSPGQPGISRSLSWYDQSNVRMNSSDRTSRRPGSRSSYTAAAAAAMDSSRPNRSRPSAATRAAFAFAPAAASRFTRIAHTAGSALPCSS